MYTARILSLVTLTALGSVACGSSSTPGGATPDAAPTDAGADAPVTPGLTDYTVRVYSVGFGADLAKPLAGAVVAFDPPGGGERQEATTGPDGKVVFKGDFSKGAGVLTAAAADHALLTFLDASPEAASKLPPNPFGNPPTDAHMVLDYVGADRTVELTGKVSGKSAPDSSVLLAASFVEAAINAAGDTYSLAIAKGRAAALVAIENKETVVGRELTSLVPRVLKVDVPAVTDKTAIDVDMSKGQAPRTVKQRIELPGGDTGALGGSTIGIVQALGLDGGFLGLTSRSAPTADKSAIECDLAVAPFDLPDNPTLTRAVVFAQDGARSFATALGAPQEGAVWKDLLPPPAITVQRQSVADPIPTEGLPAAATSCSVQLTAGNKLRWRVLGPYEKGCPASIRLPAPPTGTTHSASYQAVLIAVAKLTPIPGRVGRLLFERTSVSRPFTLTR